jgi:hypothetical protein
VDLDRVFAARSRLVDRSRYRNSGQRIFMIFNLKMKQKFTVFTF